MIFWWLIMYSAFGYDDIETLNFFNMIILPNIILVLIGWLSYKDFLKHPEKYKHLQQQKTTVKKKKYDGYIHGVRKVTWFTKRRFK